MSLRLASGSFGFTDLYDSIWNSVPRTLRSLLETLLPGQKV